MGWPGPVTERQYKAWLAWLRPDLFEAAEILPDGPERREREAEARRRKEERLLKAGWVKGPDIRRSDVKF